MFGIELCDQCTKPATTILRYDGDHVEMYCDEHWEARNRKFVAPVICEDCKVQKNAG